MTAAAQIIRYSVAYGENADTKIAAHSGGSVRGRGGPAVAHEGVSTVSAGPVNCRRRSPVQTWISDCWPARPLPPPASARQQLCPAVPGVLAGAAQAASGWRPMMDA